MGELIVDSNNGGFFPKIFFRDLRKNFHKHFFIRILQLRDYPPFSTPLTPLYGGGIRGRGGVYPYMGGYGGYIDHYTSLSVISPSLSLYDLYGGYVNTMTCTSKLRPSGREVINMSWCHVDKSYGIKCAKVITMSMCHVDKL